MAFFRPTRIAAVVAATLMAAGASALWLAADSNRAVATASRAPATDVATTDVGAIPVELPQPVAATAKSREEKRFARVDRDDDGRITAAEYLHLRRRNFDRLDQNGDGRLSFEEYATAGAQKFRTADGDRDGLLTNGEFATTAPKPKKAAVRCQCPPTALAAADEPE